MGLGVLKAHLRRYRISRFKFRSFWGAVILSGLWTSSLVAGDFKIKPELCLYALTKALADETHPIIHPLQVDIGREEGLRKLERIKEKEDDPVEFRKLREDGAVPIIRHLLPDGTQRLYFSDHHHESWAMLQRHGEAPKDPRFQYVYGWRHLTLRDPSRVDFLKTLYINGRLFPFKRNDDFLDRDGRLLSPDEVFKRNLHLQIPDLVEDLGDSPERSFGGQLRDRIGIPHHIAMLEFRLARAAILRWDVKSEWIPNEMRKALEKAEDGAKKDHDFIQKLISGVSFQTPKNAL